MDTVLLKRKTAMLLYGIEEALGSYVTDHEHEINSTPENYNDLKIKDAVEKAYLDDIFNLVLKATKNTSEESASLRLYQLAHELNLFEIRNAIAHPNRPFLDVYWYRVAAIAADPLFENLGIVQIKAHLYSAESGTIEDPPEGWDRKFRWDIPNNLPSKFESDITGLIGRNKELHDLKEKISSPRNNTIAIIAPGGFGKTAIALDLLKDIVTTSASTEWVDAVAYITLKTETWENNKFVKLDAISEISAVEKTIAEQLGIIFDEYIDDLEQAISSFSNKRIILCIDNLETILRDKDELFHNLVEKLPISWKVVVTSRVIITNALIYTLGELNQGAATHLARVYNRNQGGDELPQEKYSKIAIDCYANPLAIKMTLDLYLAGNEIPNSINEAKSNIAHFSFNNLIESLSQNTLKVLELIFIQEDVNRALICQTLGLSVDDAASTINELSRTSLIHRNSNEEKEKYEINGSIKELLVINPKCLEIRTEIQEKIKHQKNISQEIDIQQRASNLPDWHFQYIPQETDDGLKILLKEFSKIRFSKRTNKTKLSEVYGLFKKHEESYKESFLFLRSLARLLEALQLTSEAETYYNRSLNANPEDKVTRYLLARFYFEKGDYKTSLKNYTSLIKEIEKEEATEDLFPFHNTLYQGYFLCHLYQGDYNPILDYTTKWKESGKLRSLFGTYRASAYKRKMETLANTEPEKAIACLNSATKILSDVYRNDGYSQASATQGFKVIEEIIYCLSKPTYLRDHAEKVVEFLEFCDEHLITIINSIKGKGTGDAIELAISLSKIEIPKNPFSEKRFWNSYAKKTPKNAVNPSDVNTSYQELTIIRLPSTPKGLRANFLFAKDDSNSEYFLHISNMEKTSWDDWIRIDVGMKIAALEIDSSSNKKSPAVTKAYLLAS